MRLWLQFITPIGLDSNRVELRSQRHPLHINLICDAQEVKPHNPFHQIYAEICHSLPRFGFVLLLIKTSVGGV